MSWIVRKIGETSRLLFPPFDRLGDAAERGVKAAMHRLSSFLVTDVVRALLVKVVL
jgi:hypothetical protein